MKLPFILPPGSKQLWHSLVKEVERSKTGDKSLMFINCFRLDDIFNAFSSGAITDRDIEVFRFLLKRKYGTVSQIARTCYPGKSISKVKKRLQRFMRHQILDSFSWEADGQVNDMSIYCLGPGGYHLLRSFNTDCGRWNRRDNIRSAYDVAGLLMANEFTLKLPHDQQDYTAEPFIKFSSIKIIPTATFKFLETIFILVVMRNQEMLDNFVSSLTGYDSLIEGQGWRNFFSTQPILLIINESDEKAKELNAIINTKSTLQRYRLSTDERIMFHPLHKAFFNVENGHVVEKIAKIFDVTQSKEVSHG